MWVLWIDLAKFFPHIHRGVAPLRMRCRAEEESERGRSGGRRADQVLPECVLAWKRQRNGSAVRAPLLRRVGCGASAPACACGVERAGRVAMSHGLGDEVGGARGRRVTGAGARGGDALGAQLLPMSGLGISSVGGATDVLSGSFSAVPGCCARHFAPLGGRATPVKPHDSDMRTLGRMGSLVASFSPRRAQDMFVGCMKCLCMV